MKRIFWTIAVLLTTLAGCRKERENEPTGEPLTIGDVTILTQDVKKDSIGILHNAVLDSVWRYVQRTVDTTVAGKRNYITSYFRKHTSKDVSGLLRKASDRPLDYQSVLRTLTVHQRTRQLLMDIFDAIREMRDFSGYPDLIENIRKIEATAAKEAIPEKEREAVVQVAVVARYSAAFWKQTIEQNIPPVYGNGRLINRFIRFIVSVHADSAGALYGLFFSDAASEAAYQSGLWVWYVEAFTK